MMKLNAKNLIIGAFIALTFSTCSKKKNSNEVVEQPPITENPPNNNTTTYIPGNSYKFYVSKNGEKHLAIEYIAGDANSKLILAAPHGGPTKPSFMKDRVENYNYGTLPIDPHHNDTGFASLTDSRTMELSISIVDTVRVRTGNRPHLIINHIHRTKFDANRRKEVATQGDINAGLAWDKFHEYIDAAKATIMAKHTSGLFIDIHGHAHTPQRIEVGYLLSKAQLKSTNINDLTSSSSIKSLVSSANTLNTLVRGANALGTLLQNETKFNATPSAAYPDPSHVIFTDGLYFNGGYNTARHGSKFGGNISGIQIEFNSEARTNNSTRTKYAGKVARAIQQFMTTYY